MRTTVKRMSKKEREKKKQKTLQAKVVSWPTTLMLKQVEHESFIGKVYFSLEILLLSGAPRGKKDCSVVCFAAWCATEDNEAQHID